MKASLPALVFYLIGAYMILGTIVCIIHDLRRKKWLMTEQVTKYEQEVTLLCEWFKKELAGSEPLVLSLEAYHLGVDAITGPQKEKIKEAINLWLNRGYELSYSQLCRGYFYALKDLDQLRFQEDAK